MKKQEKGMGTGMQQMRQEPRKEQRARRMRSTRQRNEQCSPFQEVKEMSRKLGLTSEEFFRFSLCTSGTRKDGRQEMRHWWRHARATSILGWWHVMPTWIRARSVVQGERNVHQGPNGELLERTYGYVIAIRSLQGNIKDMKVLQEFESRPYKPIAFQVERDREVQVVRKIGTPEALPRLQRRKKARQKQSRRRS